MKSAVTTVNAGLSFALEMGMLAALCYWGIRTGRGTPAKISLAGGAMAAGIAVWALFLAAEGHTVQLPKVAEAVLKLAVFLVAGAVLATSSRRLGFAFAGFAALSVLIEYTVGT